MPNGVVPKVLKKHTKAIYLTHGEDDQDIRHFFQHLKTACLGMLKSACLRLLPFLRCFLGFKKENTPLYFSLFMDPHYFRMKMFKRFKNGVEGIYCLEVN